MTTSDWEPGDPLHRDEREPFSCPQCGTTWTAPVIGCPFCTHLPSSAPFGVTRENQTGQEQQ